MKTITYVQLAEADACKPGLKQFKSLFGESVELTEELAVQHAQTLDFHWAGMYLLSGAQREEYVASESAAWEACVAARSAAWEAYHATRRAAWEAYVAACKTAFEVYNATRRAAGEVYDAAIGAAYEKYRTALALAFVRAYNSEEAESGA